MDILTRRNDSRGMFVVRKSTKEMTKHQYTLDVLYEGHDFHIPLRKRDDGDFAMGTFQQSEDVSIQRVGPF